jgi:hypothetical protein
MCSLEKADWEIWNSNAKGEEGNEVEGENTRMKIKLVCYTVTP